MINYEAIPNSNKINVPFWQHTYISSFSEIYNASDEQIEFYHYFKRCLLDGKYIDLQDNYNYAFLLYQDVSKEYHFHSDFNKLEKQLNILGQYYPITNPYCQSRLKKIIENNMHYYWYDDTPTGYQYREILNLNEKARKILNKHLFIREPFSTFEYYKIELVKLFLETINELEKYYLNEGSSCEEQFSRIIDIYKGEYINTDICHDIFYDIIAKLCENELRCSYEFTRNIPLSDRQREVEAKYESKELLIKIKEIISKKLGTVSPPDLDAEIKFNELNKSRWKVRFENLVNNFKSSTEQLFFEDVKILADLNKNNPTINNLFFESFKFLKTVSKESALTMYCYYIHYHCNTYTTPHKSITKNEQKLLFTTQQQQDFNAIVTELICTKNINQALQDISLLYVANRKSIKLNKDAIEQAHQKYSNTVNLLNIYLQDEEMGAVIGNNNVQNVTSNPSDNKVIKQSTSINTLGLDEYQLEVLRIFPMSNYSVLQVEIEKIAKEKSLFKNQLIDSINEICYEHLDDVLIEEENEYYIINEIYYQRIIESC